MWQIIRTELGYHRVVLIGMLLANLIVIVLPEIDLAELNVDAMWLPYLIAAYTIFSHQKKEKRERLFALLPCSSWRIGVARLVLPTLLHVILLVAYLAFNFSIEPKYPHLVWIRLSIAGSLLLPWMLFVVVFRDLRLGNHHALRWSLLGVMISLSATVLLWGLPIISEYSASSSFLQKGLVSPIGTLSIYLVSFVLASYGVRVYQNRQSLLE